MNNAKLDHISVMAVTVFQEDENFESAKLILTYKDGTTKEINPNINFASEIRGNITGEMPIESLNSYMQQEVNYEFKRYIENMEPEVYTINALMKRLKPGRCALQSTRGPLTEFTPYFYVEPENKWYGYTRNGNNNIHIYANSRQGDREIWYPTQTTKKILPYNHEVTKHLKELWIKKYREYGNVLKGLRWPSLLVGLYE